MTDEQISRVGFGAEFMWTPSENGTSNRSSQSATAYHLDGMSDELLADIVPRKGRSRWGFFVSYKNSNGLRSECSYASKEEALDGLRAWLNQETSAE